MNSLDRLSKKIGPKPVTPTEVTSEMVVRGAEALWKSRNPDTPLSSLDFHEREAAWANTLADAEATLERALNG